MLNVSDYNFLSKIYSKNKKNLLTKSNIKKITGIDKTYLNDLNLNGFCKIKGLFSSDLIDNLRNNFQTQINSLSNISIPRDLKNKTKDIENIYIEKLDQKTFESGEKIFRNHTDSIKLKDPLINLPESINIALDEKIVSICENYFGCTPYLTFLKCVKTYANNLDDFDTQHFHIDENAVNLLKVFVYLNDVTSIKDGPFTYVEGSFKDIKSKWGLKARWEENELRQYYEQNKFKHIFANRGDVIIANTVAFHKGLKPILNDRNILIFNYGLHVDYTFNNKPDIVSRISNKAFNIQSNKNKNILALLEKI